jgi:hypothetical protein
MKMANVKVKLTRRQQGILDNLKKCAGVTITKEGAAAYVDDGGSISACMYHPDEVKALLDLGVAHKRKLTVGMEVIAAN